MKIKRLLFIFYFSLCCCLVSTISYCIVSKADDGDIGFTEDELVSDGDYIVENSQAFIPAEFSGEENNSMSELCKYYFSVDIKNFRGVQETVICFQYENFSVLEDYEKKTILKDLKSSGLYQSLKNNCKSKLIEMIAKTAKMSNSTALESVFGEIKPDLVEGFNLYRPFNSKVNLILAVASIITMFAISASFVLDLFYINVPIIQNKLEDTKISKYISRSAKIYVKEISSDENILHSSLDYFKDRVITLGVFGMLLVYLFAGKFIVLIQAIISLVRGFL